MTSGGLSRRGFLVGGAAAAGIAGTAGAVALATGGGNSTATQQASLPAAPGPPTSIAFDGEHQPGITTPAPLLTTFIGLDLVDRSAEGLDAVLRLLSDDARRLMAGEPALADPVPQNAESPASLTIGIGLGRGAFAAAGLTPPVNLAEIPSFRGDALEERWGQTDLIVQVGSDSPLALEHALVMIDNDVTGLATTRWTQAGFTGTSVGTLGAHRNLMGQVDGTANPRSDGERAEHVWINEGPDWIIGGTVLVLRRIRMDLHGWATLDDHAKELVVGRTLDSGAPLSGGAEGDPIDLEATDDRGLRLIPPSSHVAVVAGTGARLLRRPFNYVDRSGEPESGLLFAAYMRDPATSFIPMQERMSRLDAMNRWVTPIGSAAYVFPRGSRPDGYLGEGLLT